MSNEKIKELVMDPEFSLKAVDCVSLLLYMTK